MWLNMRARFPRSAGWLKDWLPGLGSSRRVGDRLNLHHAVRMTVAAAAKGPFEGIPARVGRVIHTLDVDPSDARPRGRDRAEDEALSDRSHQRGMGSDRTAAAAACPQGPLAGHRPARDPERDPVHDEVGRRSAHAAEHFPPWQTVYWWFRRFVRLMLFRTIHDIALMEDRMRQGREASPTAGCWR